ncbi:hypothetical protein AB0C33_38615 [Nonomuraea sp. NPDC048881]|uniref:hypothetical protein n=1 Tax=Nonomuraea sp. NPDC048881 TaxID=3155030 RepID=UPI0033D65672
MNADIVFTGVRRRARPPSGRWHGAAGRPGPGGASVEEVREAVQAWAAAHPEAEWITGDGVDPWLAPDGTFDVRGGGDAEHGRPGGVERATEQERWYRLLKYVISGDQTLPKFDVPMRWVTHAGVWSKTVPICAARVLAVAAGVAPEA